MVAGYVDVACTNADGPLVLRRSLVAVKGRRRSFQASPDSSLTLRSEGARRTANALTGHEPSPFREPRLVSSGDDERAEVG